MSAPRIRRLIRDCHGFREIILAPTANRADAPRLAREHPPAVLTLPKPLALTSGILSAALPCGIERRGRGRTSSPKSTRVAGQRR